MLVVLTHDVDWGRRGPSESHILERLSRFGFEDRMRFFTLRENLYNGITLIMEYEQRYGIKSTFFFRPIYDDGTTVELYSDIASELRRGNWEIGLHANSGKNLNAIAEEKKTIEKIYVERIISMRVHYLDIDPSIISRLGSIGIELDSSLMKSKNRFLTSNSGCIIYGDVIEIPITIMDTYMFSYWGIPPTDAYRKLIEMLKTLYNEKAQLITILWHTNSVRMIGGRDYLRFVEEMWRYEWIEPIRVCDVKRLAYLCSPSL